MLPHNHFLISSAVIVPAALIASPKDFLGLIAMWVLAGGLATMAIDFDIVILTIIKSKRDNRLKKFVNPLNIYLEFKLFMRLIKEAGVLKTGLKTHLISSCLIVLVFYSFFNAYYIPVLLAVISHLISDFPNLAECYTNHT